MTIDKIVKIFTMEQQFPCGLESSCCGPIGQSEEEVTSLKSAIEKLGVDVEIYDIQKAKSLQEHPYVLRLLSAFGYGAIPIITVGDEVVQLGRYEKIDDTILNIKSKL